MCTTLWDIISFTYIMDGLVYSVLKKAIKQALWFGLSCHCLFFLINQEILEHLIPLSVDELHGKADFLFQWDLTPARRDVTRTDTYGFDNKFWKCDTTCVFFLVL